jgi:hypothetical protein
MGLQNVDRQAAEVCAFGGFFVLREVYSDNLCQKSVGIVLMVS